MQTTPLPPAPDYLRAAEDSNLRVLAIFHFVFSGLYALMLLFLGIHYFFMRALFGAGGGLAGGVGAGLPSALETIMGLFYLVGGIFIVAGAVLNALSGTSLLKKENRTLSMVVAGLNCLAVPLGTILGIFTLLVLLRPSVIQIYQNQAAGSLR